MKPTWFTNLVYQFVLPPLTFFCFRSGNAEKLMLWLMNLEEPPNGCMFFNFLSSHDGIGLMPIEKILDEEERHFIEKCTLESGGRLSYKDNGDGTLSAYELNINYQDALTANNGTDSIRIERFLSAETFLISLKGVPRIYIQSLLGSRNHCPQVFIPSRWSVTAQNPDNVAVVAIALTQEFAINPCIFQIKDDRSKPP